MEYPLHTLSHHEFPGSLTEIPDPPKSLYVRGAVPPPNHKLLAIVGSRAYSTYGKQAVERIVSGLRGYPITIISGLAIGIDTLAHKAALENDITTLAVPGSGLNETVLYPARNKPLARTILAKGGGLISEFEPDFRAVHWSFPQRNRIMAGIADAVLVVEATLKSGTLITSRLATDYNRDVLTIPGSIFSRNSDGPHMLIKLGATPVTSSADVLEALHLKKTDGVEPLPHESFSAEEQQLLSLLSTPLSRDALIRALACPTPEANARIMLLELRGVISESHGVFVRNV